MLGFSAGSLAALATAAVAALHCSLPRSLNARRLPEGENKDLIERALAEDYYKIAPPDQHTAYGLWSSISCEPISCCEILRNMLKKISCSMSPTLLDISSLLI